jgi:molybdopterin-guanine dinucleotide biosynthesis protein A
MPAFGGIILCGGKSSRMGQAKAWLPFGAEVMLQRTIRIVGAVADPVVVVAAPGQELPALPGEVLIARDELEGRGPLQGLAAGLSALGRQAECAFLASCDLPFLRTELVKRICSMLPVDGGSTAIAAPFVEGRFHPLAAAYRTSVLPAVQQLLTEGTLRLTTLLELLPTRAIAPEELKLVDPELDSLRNINTPQEYEAALKSLGH